MYNKLRLDLPINFNRSQSRDFNRMRESNLEYSEYKKFNKNKAEWERSQDLRYLQAALSRGQMDPLSLPHPDVTKVMELLPHNFVKFVEALSANSHIPSFPTALMALSCISTTFQGKITIQGDTTWSELTPVWVVCGAPSGYGKSLMTRKLRNPFDDFNKKIKEQYNFINMSENKELLLNKIKENKKELIENVFKESKGTLSSDNIVYLRRSLEEQDKIREEINNNFTQKNNSIAFIDDISSKAFCKLLQENGEVGAIISCEGTMLNRVQNKTDITPIVKCYNQEGGSYQINRNIVELTSPFLGMTIFTQPKPAIEFLKNQSLIEAGLCGRILPYCVFDQESLEVDSIRLDAEMIMLSLGKYNDKILSLLELYSNTNIKPQSITIGVDASAYGSIKNFQNEINAKQHEYPKQMQPWLSKAHGHALRLALCIHAWNKSIPHESEITAREMLQAIALIKTLMDHLSFIYSPHGYKAYINANKIIKSLLSVTNVVDILDNGITSRTIQQRTGINKEEVNNALRILELCGYLAIYDDGGPNFTVVLHNYFYSRYDNPML